MTLNHFIICSSYFVENPVNEVIKVEGTKVYHGSSCIENGIELIVLLLTVADTLIPECIIN